MFGNGLSCIEKPHQLPCGWTLRTIDELKAEGKYTCVGGPFGSNLTRTDYVDKGVPVIRGSNISTDTAIFIDEDFVYVTEEKANNLLQNLAYPGDVIFTQRGTLGQVALIPPTARHCRYLISQSQMKLTPFEEIIDPNYLVQYFRSQHALQFLNSRVLATGVPHINLGVLKAFPVVVPPILLQRKFAEFKQRRQILQRGAALHEVESDHLFSSLIQHAFRGEL
jgi:type I restriction enzyme S subunit